MMIRNRANPVAGRREHRGIHSFPGFAGNAFSVGNRMRAADLFAPLNLFPGNGRLEACSDRFVLYRIFSKQKATPECPTRLPSG
jgi:hypothetical protein